MSRPKDPRLCARKGCRRVASRLVRLDHGGTVGRCENHAPDSDGAGFVADRRRGELPGQQLLPYAFDGGR